MSIVITDQKITHTLETNYMPYAMSVIISRAIPEIDGFKPSHRKLLYTMYKMGLMTGARTKSANVVGATMKLNPHGDAAIYETMVRLTRSCESLIVPYVDSKGNFGKQYSRDMSYAAARYTEVKLEPVCRELFCDIDKDTVDMVDNYDGQMKEPTLLPVTFPNILVNPNQGIAVGMASSMCSFNLREVCETTIALLEDPDHDPMTTLIAPDFPGGGQLIYDPKVMREIYESGRGSFRVRAKYRYDKKNSCIEVYEIPYTTTVEAIIDKIAELVKSGKVRDVSDVRDETGLDGLRLTIDLKRGADPDRLMQKLYKLTPLEDSFACNFNVLIAGTPKVMGVAELLNEWSAFRIECVKRRLYFDVQKLKKRLHLLYGLKKILLDIDKAIAIVRDTESDDEVVPNLMIGFGIDEAQAEYIAEIKLRNLNKRYVLNAIADVEKLEKELKELESTLKSREKIVKLIISELRDVIKKYGADRRTEVIEPSDGEEVQEIDETPDYPVNLFLTRGGYFKKITMQSLEMTNRMSGEHKLKDEDEYIQQFASTNKAELLFFTDKGQVYKCRANDFADSKASVLGDYIPAKLGFDAGENVVFMAHTTDYSGFMLFFFKNGRVAKVPMNAYATKTNRRKLSGAYCVKFPLACALQMAEEGEVVMMSSAGKVLAVHSLAIPAKSTRDTQGIVVMTLRAKAELMQVMRAEEAGLSSISLYRVKSLPAAGRGLSANDKDINQTSLI